MVEDHGDTSRFMTLLLKGQGHDVHNAAGVQDALTAASAREFDLLISDIGLPDGTGIDLMRQLMTIRPIKGIALSGYADAEHVRKCREAGFVAHVSKPVDLAKLEALIRQLT